MRRKTLKLRYDWPEMMEWSWVEAVVVYGVIAVVAGFLWLLVMTR